MTRCTSIRLHVSWSTSPFVGWPVCFFAVHILIRCRVYGIVQRRGAVASVRPSKVLQYTTEPCCTTKKSYLNGIDWHEEERKNRLNLSFFSLYFTNFFLFFFYFSVFFLCFPFNFFFLINFSVSKCTTEMVCTTKRASRVKALKAFVLDRWHCLSISLSVCLSGHASMGASNHPFFRQ